MKIRTSLLSSHARIQSYAVWVQRHRVLLGALFVPLFLLLVEPQPIFMAAGLLLALAGVGLRFWAAGHLHKGRSLTVSGPYAYTRNPLYLGSLLMLCGALLGSRSLTAAILAGAGFAAIYIPTMRREELELRAGFAADFDRYCAAVPRFWPRWTRYPEASSAAFQFRQAWRNREYNALPGCVAIFSLLYLKWRLFP